MNDLPTSTGAAAHHSSGQQTMLGLLSLLSSQSRPAQQQQQQHQTNQDGPPLSAHGFSTILQSQGEAPLTEQQMAETAGLLLQTLGGSSPSSNGGQPYPQAHAAAAVASSGPQPQVDSQEASRQRVNAELLALLAINNGMNLGSQQGHQSQSQGNVGAPAQLISAPPVYSSQPRVEQTVVAHPPQSVPQPAQPNSGFNELVASLLGKSIGAQQPRQQGRAGGEAKQYLGPGHSTPTPVGVKATPAPALPDLQQLLAAQGSNQSVGVKATPAPALPDLQQLLAIQGSNQSDGVKATPAPALPDLQQLLAIQGTQNDFNTKPSSTASQASSLTDGIASGGVSYEPGSIGGRTSLARKGYPLRDIECPGPHDVLMGRGSGTSSHAGNVKYRDLVLAYKPRYVAADRVNKPSVAGEVVELWRSMEPPGRFLDRNDSEDDDNNLWFDVGDRRARRKTSQTLREKTRPKTGTSVETK